MSNNLDIIWNKVKTPDPKHVKNFNRGGGFKGSATNTQYIIQQATELFGPDGIGWGIVIDDEQYIEGHQIDEFNKCIIHVVRGHVWYKIDDEIKRTSQQFGQTTFVGSNRHGVFTDEEAPKKSVTDMMLKCLSLIGFSADIFMGKWDDNKYVNDVRKGMADREKKYKENQEKHQKRNDDLNEQDKVFGSICKVLSGLDSIEAINDYAKDIASMVEKLDKSYQNEVKQQFAEAREKIK